MYLLGFTEPAVTPPFALFARFLVARVIRKFLAHRFKVSEKSGNFTFRLPHEFY